MLKKKTLFAAGFAAITATLVTVGCAGNGTTESASGHPYTKMSANELAEHLIFEAGGFRLDQPTQEGGTARDRMVQDELQLVCTESRNRPAAEQAGQITAAARASIQYPEGGIELGDWQEGAKRAWGGFGFRIVHNPDDHTKRQPDGLCYNCHALDPNRPGGTVGPSLTGYGKSRGNNEATRRFVYEMIYNAHAYFPCTDMPRFGAKNILTQKDIADVMAYVLHPDSPVNK